MSPGDILGSPGNSVPGKIKVRARAASAPLGVQLEVGSRDAFLESMAAAFVSKGKSIALPVKNLDNDNTEIYSENNLDTLGGGYQYNTFGNIQLSTIEERDEDESVNVSSASAAGGIRARASTSAGETISPRTASPTSSGENPGCSGVLWKRGHRFMHGWNMRYFMYNAEQDPPFTYYTIDRHFQPKMDVGSRGAFYVLSVTSKNAFPSKEHGFQMEVLETRGMECMPGAGVTLHMAATSRVEKHKWVSAIEAGISRIMKRAVGVVEPMDANFRGGSPRGMSSNASSDSSGSGSHEKRKLSMMDFNVLRLLGRGNFGTVVLVELKVHALPMQHTRHYAVKILNKQRMNSYTRHGTKREREIMAGVAHPFIATLAFAFQTSDKLFLGMEYLQV
jgi:hypothetical protein